MGRGNFEEGKGRPIVKYWDLGHSVVICAKTAKPFEMPFGLWARMDPRNHVVDETLQVLRDIAMATTFWLSISVVLIGATRRIRLNRPCAAAMRPYVKLL